MNAQSLLRSGAGLALLVLAGCTVGPDYRRPAVDAPAFKEAGDWKPAEPGDQLPRGKWWQAFGDPVLNDLEDRVDVSSNTLREADLESARLSLHALLAQSYFALRVTEEDQRLYPRLVGGRRGGAAAV
jgi:outer membrane protein TolC